MFLFFFIFWNNSFLFCLFLQITENNGIKTKDQIGWWPSVSDLLDAHINVIGGVQEVGDLVILPTNCFHFGFSLVCISTLSNTSFYWQIFLYRKQDAMCLLVSSLKKIWGSWLMLADTAEKMGKPNVFWNGPSSRW